MTCKPQNAPDVTTLMSAAQTGTTKSSVAMMKSAFPPCNGRSVQVVIAVEETSGVSSG